YPTCSRKLKETPKTEQRVEVRKKRDVEIETASEMKGTKQEWERKESTGYTIVAFKGGNMAIRSAA
ncbi:protein tic 214, partial [Phtheirospermum japonicum]